MIFIFQIIIYENENLVDVPSYRVVLNLTTILIHCFIYPTGIP